MLALLSPKESKKKDHPLSPKSARAGARAAAGGDTAHPLCRALKVSLLHPSPHTPTHRDAGPRPALGAQGAHPAAAARGPALYI